MDETRRKLESGVPHIWLRYATQFTLNGRACTVEIGIPVPLGASAEERERLLQEADTGINQLSAHVEQRVAQMLKRPPQTQGTPSGVPTPIPADRPSGAPSRPATAPAANPAPQTSAYSSTTASSPVVREGDPAQTQRREATAPPRQHVSASMPLTPILGEGNGSLSLPQFIQHIKDSYGLTPKQAMELLKVKTLSGLNLREALEQLQYLVTQGGGAAAKPDETGPRPREEQPSRSEERSGRGDEKEVRASNPAPSNPPPVTPTRHAMAGAASLNAGPAKITPIDQRREGALGPREEPAPQSFDEEIDLEEDEIFEDDLEDLDEPRELTPLERVRGKKLLNQFRETRGTTQASPNRLQALHNVTSSQITHEQLQSLIEGIWNVSSTKKLKVDQVEALISWAKEDDFVNDVEIVLATLEEEQYARGNR